MTDPDLNLPDGTYYGTWGGHTLKFTASGREYIRYTEAKVDTFEIDVTFEIRSGRIIEETIKPRKD